MSRWFRISVAKWGRECFRVSYGRPKFTLLVLGNLGLELWGPNSRGPIAALQRQGDQCEYAQIQTSNLMIHILKKHIDKII